MGTSGTLTYFFFKRVYLFRLSPFSLRGVKRVNLQMDSLSHSSVCLFEKVIEKAEGKKVRVPFGVCVTTSKTLGDSNKHLG